MTPEQIEELAELERAATAGPWCIHPNGTSLWSGARYDSDDREQRHILNGMSVNVQTVDDLWLLCEARNALPELLAMARDYERWKAKGYDYTVEDLSHQVDGFREMAARDAADLLAARRALKLAQAKAIKNLSRYFDTVGGNCMMADDGEYQTLRNGHRQFRAARLCDHYAAKFEREAEEMGNG